MLISWNTTRRCNLVCRHCYRDARPCADPDELTTAEGKGLIDEIARAGFRLLVLSGGEPLLREDLLELTAYATDRSLRAVLGTNGTLIDARTAADLKRAGLARVGVSLDGTRAEVHDALRGVPGAFERTLAGIACCREAGLPFQVHTTLTRANAGQIEEIGRWAAQAGAAAYHVFFLVPTGRAAAMTEEDLGPAEHERVIGRLLRLARELPIEVHPTCAPQFMRIARQSNLPMRFERGCLAGTAYACVLPNGDVQPCPYLPIALGNVRRTPFSEIWQSHPVLRRLREEKPGGKCGVCEYVDVCGGCRARAFFHSGGDYMAEEPWCSYVPKAMQPTAARSEDSPHDNQRFPEVLDLIQSGFPLLPRPYRRLGEELGLSEEEVHARLCALRREGLIRRIGGVVNSRALGRTSTLVAMKVDPDRIESVAEQLNALPGLTHNYLREHAYNVWFTLSAGSGEALASLLGQVRREEGVLDVLNLPTLRAYKIDVRFRFASESQAPSPPPPPLPEGPVPLTDEQRRVLVELGDLGRELAPYDEPARRAGMDVERFLATGRELLRMGVLRKVTASINHGKAGFLANALCVWAVPKERMDEAGQTLAAFPEVTHCYRRAVPPGWPYALFSMVHGRSREQTQTVVRRLAEAVRPTAYEVIYSTRELKKTSLSPTEALSLPPRTHG